MSFYHKTMVKPEMVAITEKSWNPCPDLTLAQPVIELEADSVNLPWRRNMCLRKSANLLVISWRDYPVSLGEIPAIVTVINYGKSEKKHFKK